MRPGQNKRMRGRPTNNRRGPNPLTRSYESNGPDVKIRGNAHHVAEKYLQLARDAHTGGDPVAAENYLQHAEHYFRLIASAQAAQALAQSGQPRPPGEGEGDDMEDDGDFGTLSDRFASPAERQNALSAAATRVSTATERGAEPPAALRRAASLRGRASGPERSGGFCQSAGPAGQPVSRTRPSDKTGRSPTGMKAIATTGMDAMAGQRDFRPYRDSQSQPDQGRQRRRRSAAGASVIHNRKPDVPTPRTRPRVAGCDRLARAGSRA